MTWSRRGLAMTISKRPRRIRLSRSQKVLAVCSGHSLPAMASTALLMASSESSSAHQFHFAEVAGLV